MRSTTTSASCSIAPAMAPVRRGESPIVPRRNPPGRSRGRWPDILPLVPAPDQAGDGNERRLDQPSLVRYGLRRLPQVPAASVTHFLVKLVFAAPASFFSAACASQAVLASFSHFVRKLFWAAPASFFSADCALQESACA